MADRLRRESVDPRGLVLCTSTDIGLLGDYRDHWLAVTPDRLLVIADGAEPEVARAIDLRQASEYRVEGGIGSGLLQARINGSYIDLLRYSNRGAYRFEKVARQLDRHLRGEPIEVEDDDHIDPRRCTSCGLLLELGSKSCPHCISRGAVLWRMLKLMRPYTGATVTMIVLLLAGIGLDLVSPQLTRYLVDDVLSGDAPQATQMNMLAGVVAVLIVVQVMRMLVNLVNGRLSSRIGNAITHDMRSRLVNHMQQLSVGFYDQQQVGSLVGRVAYDTEAMHDFLKQLTGGFLLQLLMLVGVAAVMFSIDVRLALYTLIPGPMVVAGTIIFWKYIYPRNYRVWDASSKQAGMLSGVLSGARVVKAFNQEGRESGRFHNASSRLMDNRRKVDAALHTFNPLMSIIFQLGGWIVWYVGGRDVIDDRLTLGELMAFFGYLWMFYGPLGTLPQFTSWLTTFATQAHRIFEILDTPTQVVESSNPVHVRDMRGHIRFEDVTFGYTRHSPVIRNLSLEIRPGEMVGVVGRSGSGKSTLVNLLCRFYDVEDGRVTVDGVDVRDIPAEELRGQVGVVLQEPYLFRGSIWENIAYGRPNATAEQVITAAKAGNCHDFIVQQPHGYDTWVGERGAGLSGGERQRIGIARVLLTDPRVLILDEATSSVDAESEAAIQAALKELIKGRTTIAIAHRLSTLRNADRIAVIDQGRLVETGPHDELMGAGGAYARLVNMQQGAQSIDENADPSATAGVTAHRPNWLTPETAQIHLGNHDALHVTVLNEGIYGGTFAVRCLPVHSPREFISLRHVNAAGHDIEIGLIRNLDEWPAQTQRLVDEALARRYFVHRIEAIHEIELVNNYLNFDVDTDLGPQQFTIRWQSDRAQDYGPRGKMLLDTDENRYLVPDVRALPMRERRLFERYIYW